MRILVLLSVVALVCSGCSTSHGLRASGPLSYYVGKGIAEDHVALAKSKGPLMEAKLGPDGTARVGFNLLNVEGWSVMNWWEKLQYAGSVVAEGVTYGFAAKKGYDEFKDWRDKDKKEEAKPVQYANDRDSLVIQNGSGTVHMDYTVPQGSPKPDNIYVTNAGGSVDLDFKEAPVE